MNNIEFIICGGFKMTEECFDDISDLMGKDEFIEFLNSEYKRKTFVNEEANRQFEGAEFEYVIQKYFYDPTKVPFSNGKSLGITKHVTKDIKNNLQYAG